MVAEILAVTFGLAVLLIAGDLLVRGAVGLATAMKIPALLVSLTVVAFGTSAPELFVTVNAVLSGKPGIAVGNIVGSNIANVLLVLGLPALIYPISAHTPGLIRHAIVLVLATGAFAALAYTQGAIDRRAGAALFFGIVLYAAFMWQRSAAGSASDPVIDDVEKYAAPTDSGRALGFLIVGLVGLPFGANLLVTNGAALAADLGVRDELIGLTIVAIGTSLPELATVLAAALHKKSDVAMGSVVGSNIFNILAVGGAAGLAGGAAFDMTALRLDIPVMAGVTVMAALFILLKRDIGRTSGALMIAAYAAFIGLAIVNAG